MDLSALADFNLVARHGAFGKAARLSGRPKATLARHVANLENSLGVRLVERGVRGLRLTDEGRALHERTDELLGEITDIGEALSSRIARPRGRLRVSAPVLFSHSHLGSLAAQFASACPEVALEVTAEDRRVELLEEGYDIAIRVSPRPDDRLIGRCFARDQMLVVAPPALAGLIRDPAWNGHVAAVAMTTDFDGGPWPIRTGDTAMTVIPQIRLRLSSLVMIRDAVRAGLGAAILPRSMVGRDIEEGRLAAWGEVTDRPIELWVLHHSRRLVSPKIAAFVAFLLAAFPDQVLRHGSQKA